MKRVALFALMLAIAGCGGGEKKSTEVKPDPDLAVKGAATGLDSEEPFHRRMSAGILMNDPAKGKEHLEKLKRMAASDKDSDVRKAAADAVKAIEKAP